MLMVQTNAQVPMKSGKVKGPPPVPPRPNQSVVAEALAKTRKAVAESRVGLKRVSPKQPTKAKTLERTASEQPPNVSPKQNGLARVKSFIRDVISDRGSSSDEKKSSGQNSRRSSSDSSTVPAPVQSRKLSESANSKAVKTCKQILVRSLSTSNKLDQDSKSKLPKSSSFAEKTLPLRKAPPPPLSPKPKLRPAISLQLNRNSLERKKLSIDVSPYSTPIDAKTPQPLTLDAPYATVEEVQEFDERLRNSPSRSDQEATEVSIPKESPKLVNSLERKTSRVTERLISEILAGRNKNTVIDKGKEETACEDAKLKDMNNHEMLIYELQTMRSQSSVADTLAGLNTSEPQSTDRSSSEETDCVSDAVSSDLTNENVDYANTYSYIVDDDLKSRLRKQFRAISNMSLQGLPPLPKSLSGFADLSGADSPASDAGSPDSCKPPTDLDSQLVYLKKEMASLRQLDLSLLSELWTLSEAMAAWRRQLERAPRLRPAPPPPPPPPHYLRT